MTHDMTLVLNIQERIKRYVYDPQPLIQYISPIDQQLQQIHTIDNNQAIE